MTPLADSGDPDAALISESLRHPEAFAALYDRHAAVIHRFAARRLGEQAADDVVGDTFLTAFRNRHRYRVDYPDARPWLYGIATRLIGRHRRAEVRMWRALARTGHDPCLDDGLGEVDDRLSATSAQPARAPRPARHAG
jgi:DNA-directed RNA polymerase specialized sigma24 family protein